MASSVAVGTSGTLGKSFSNNLLGFDGGCLCQLFEEYVGTSWAGELREVSKFHSSHKISNKFPESRSKEYSPVGVW